VNFLVPEEYRRKVSIEEQADLLLRAKKARRLQKSMIWATALFVSCFVTGAVIALTSPMERYGWAVLCVVGALSAYTTGSLAVHSRRLAEDIESYLPEYEELTKAKK